MVGNCASVFCVPGVTTPPGNWIRCRQRGTRAILSLIVVDIY